MDEYYGLLYSDIILSKDDNYLIFSVSGKGINIKMRVSDRYLNVQII
jgi:hypothetical protein